MYFYLFYLNYQKISDVFLSIFPELVEIDPVFKFIKCELSKKNLFQYNQLLNNHYQFLN